MYHKQVHTTVLLAVSMLWFIAMPAMLGFTSPWLAPILMDAMCVLALTAVWWMAGIRDGAYVADYLDATLIAGVLWRTAVLFGVAGIGYPSAVAIVAYVTQSALALWAVSLLKRRV